MNEADIQETISRSTAYKVENVSDYDNPIEQAKQYHLQRSDIIDYAHDMDDITVIGGIIQRHPSTDSAVIVVTELQS